MRHDYGSPFSRSSTSPEVSFPFSVLDCDALSGAAGLRTIPLRLGFAVSPRVADLLRGKVAPAVFRCAKAMRCCSARGTTFEVFVTVQCAAWPRRLNGGTTHLRFVV